MNIKSDCNSVVVTGVAGKVGGQTALEFAAAGYSVLGIDTILPQKTVIDSLTRFVQSHFGSDRALLEILKHRPVKIIYCGSSSKKSEKIIEYDDNGAKLLTDGINELGYYPEIITNYKTTLSEKT